MDEMRVTLVWVALMALTLVAFVFAEMGYQGQVFVIAILASAWIKGQMIIDQFMELRKVRLLWRLIISLWLLIVLLVIGLMYWTFG